MKKRMGWGRFLWTIFLSALVLGPEAQGDPYNAYRYNRKSYDIGLPGTDRGDWYEWWYYKALSDDGTPFFWVYGVVNPWDKDSSRPASRAHLTMGNFGSGKIHEQRFAVTDFEAAYHETFVRVHESVATDRFSGSIPTTLSEVSWDLRIDRDWGWNAMGWGLPFNSLVDISWYPAQAAARMSGTVNYEGRGYTFTRVPAYQDRNWGRSFPKWWFWIVGNDFVEDPSAALACGGGMPKFVGHEVIPALSCGLKVGDKEYSFRSSDLDKYKYDIRFGRWDLTLSSMWKKIHIVATAPREKFIDLQFMSPSGSIFHDFEALLGEITVDFYTWSFFGGWRLDKHLTSSRGGIEYGSENPAMLEEAKVSESKP